MSANTGDRWDAIARMTEKVYRVTGNVRLDHDIHGNLRWRMIRVDGCAEIKIVRTGMDVWFLVASWEAPGTDGLVSNWATDATGSPLFLPEKVHAKCTCDDEYRPWMVFATRRCAKAAIEWLSRGAP